MVPLESSSKPEPARQVASPGEADAELPAKDAGPTAERQEKGSSRETQVRRVAKKRARPVDPGTTASPRPEVSTTPADANGTHPGGTAWLGRARSAALNALPCAAAVLDENGVILWANRAVHTLTGHDAADVVGRGLRSFEPSPVDDEGLLSLWRTVRSEGSLRSIRPHVRRDGTPYVADLRLAKFRVGGRRESLFIATWHSSGPVAASHPSSAATARRWERQLKATAEMSMLAIHRWDDLLLAVQRMLEVATEAVEVEQASIWWPGAGQDIWCCVNRYERASAAHSIGGTVAAEQCAGLLAELRANGTLSVTDAPRDPRTAELFDRTVGSEGVTAVLAALMIDGKGEAAGFVALESKAAGRTWTEDEAVFLRCVAGQVSQAWFNHEARAAMDEVASLRERLAEPHPTDFTIALVPVEPEPATPEPLIAPMTARVEPPVPQEPEISFVVPETAESQPDLTAAFLDCWDRVGSRLRTHLRRQDTVYLVLEMHWLKLAASKAGARLVAALCELEQDILRLDWTSAEYHLSRLARDVERLRADPEAMRGSREVEVDGDSEPA